ncbi:MULTISPECIES: hypothetical protein [unclassified Microbacterium]|uniref:hypothetical protein n=1 Tax=unclassified Microbacterium TaxID=2609290 RepID=UPI0038655D2C
MATDVKKHDVPSGGEAPSRSAFSKLALSIRDYIPVADVTERAQKIADLTAANLAPSLSNPILVFRADAPDGKGFEYTTDGTTWRVLDASSDNLLSGVFDNVLQSAANWNISAQSGRKKSGVAFVSFYLIYRGATVTVPANGDIGNQVVGTFVSGWAPASGMNYPLVSANGGAVAVGRAHSGGVEICAVAPGTVMQNGTTFSLLGSYPI